MLCLAILFTVSACTVSTKNRNGTDITDKQCNISDVRKKMGMVFHGFNLFGHLTVLENVMLAPMELMKMPKRRRMTVRSSYCVW